MLFSIWGFWQSPSSNHCCCYKVLCKVAPFLKFLRCPFPLSSCKTVVSTITTQLQDLWKHYSPFSESNDNISEILLNIVLWEGREVLQFNLSNKIQSSKSCGFYRFVLLGLASWRFFLGFFWLVGCFFVYLFCISLNPKRHMSLSLVSEINHFLPKCSCFQSWLGSDASENRPVLTNYCCYISFSTSLKTEPVKNLIWQAESYQIIYDGFQTKLHLTICTQQKSTSLWNSSCIQFFFLQVYHFILYFKRFLLTEICFFLLWFLKCRMAEL